MVFFLWKGSFDYRHLKRLHAVDATSRCTQKTFNLKGDLFRLIRFCCINANAA